MQKNFAQKFPGLWYLLLASETEFEDATLSYTSLFFNVHDKSLKPNYHDIQANDSTLWSGVVLGSV